jgi:hypothetical protein
MSADSSITSANQLTLDVLNPATDLASSLAPLSVGLSGLELRLQPTCAQGGNFSTFLVTGSGGVPSAPSNWLFPDFLPATPSPAPPTADQERAAAHQR